MKTKSYFLILFLLFSFSFLNIQPFLYADGDNSMTSVDEGDELKEPEKEEKGIMATMALCYVKCRDAVKSAYDEIQYWRGIKHSYENLKKWFKRNREKVVNLKECAVELFTDPGDLWAKLEKTEEMFDRFDDIAFYETARFENSLIRLETSFDYAQLLPNTVEVLRILDETFFNVNPEHDKTIAIEQKEDLEIIEKEREYTEDIYNEDEEKKIIEATKFLIASSISESNMYHNWAIRSVKHYNNLDSDFSKYDGIKHVEMKAAWWELEDCNANNKKMRHMSAETKLYLAKLGLDLYEWQKKRAISLNYSNNANEFINALKN